MMTCRLALVLAGAFTVSLVSVLTAGPADAVCRPNCLDLNKNKGGLARGLNRANDVAGEHGRRGRDNAAHKQELHKKDGFNDPPTTPPPVTPPPVEPPPCIGC